MKRHILLIFLLAIYFIPNLVKAEGTYTTNTDYFMSSNDYNNLRKIYSDEYISTMDATEYYNLMNMGIDFDSVIQDIKYVREEINHITGEIIQTPISEYEYEHMVIPENNDRSVYYETSSRKLVLSIARSSSVDTFITTSLIWKTVPSVRSFDDIGMRIINADMVMGTQIGKQIYTAGGTNHVINYSYNGTNSKYFDNGFGISMNLKDDTNITKFELDISVNATILSYPVSAYGTCQHAVSDITLATAKNYTIGYGHGEVFVFGGNTGSYYDAFVGVHTSLSS